MDNIMRIEEHLSELRERLKNHKLYNHLSEVEDIKVFMEKHVYAVWDFMSLLKALQQQLTCISIPWKPSNNPKTARFINEIVLGEETDVNEIGVPKSHFDMYIDAMDEVEADTKKILHLVSSIHSMEDVIEKLQNADLKKAEKDFLEFTFKTIKTKEVHKIAAAFTFGREDLIPDMFLAIIDKSNNTHGNQFPKLSYYLNRHIELDGDEHGPLSLEMISELCGDDQNKWNDVLQTSVEALQKRIHLWDEISDEIKQRKAVHYLIMSQIGSARINKRIICFLSSLIPMRNSLASF